MKTYPLTKEDKELILKARNLVKKRKVTKGEVGHVGCALLTKKNKIFTGVCLHLSCGLGFCAEASAIANMISHSNSTEIKTIVASNDHRIMAPCGRCREMMNIINKNNHKNTFVIISKKEKTKLKELLPENWLEKKK